MFAVIDFVLLLTTVISLSFGLGIHYITTGHFTNVKLMDNLSEIILRSYRPSGDLYWQLAYGVLGLVFTGYMHMWYCFTLMLVVPFLMLAFVAFLKHRVQVFGPNRDTETSEMVR